MSDKLIDAAVKLGRQHGKARAEITTKYNFTEKAARAILKGYEEQDEDTLDICPKPLAGEWVDDPVPMSLLDEIANLAGSQLGSLRGQDIDDDSGDVLDAYEKAYTATFWVEFVNHLQGIAI